jgi:hypothetical protein
MLVDSEEDATDILVKEIERSGLDVTATLTAWGAPEMDILNRVSPVSQLAAIFTGLYQGNLISPNAQRYILDLMAVYTPSDRTRLGTMIDLLPSGAIIYNKRGTVTDIRLVIGDAAIVTWQKDGKTQTYILIMFGYPGEIQTTDAQLEAGIDQAAQAFSQYALSPFK